ncbi:hypothetical protein Tco_0468771 [Tanacetum coccineum]
MVASKSIKSRMYTFPPMMVSNSRKHHYRVRPYTREVLVISTNLDIQKNHYPLDFTNRREVEARIKNTWYNQGFGSQFDTAYPRVWIRRIGVSWCKDHILYLPEYSHTISLIRRIDFFWRRHIDLLSFVVFGECRHRYAISSLMDTAYWSSK